MKEQTLYFQDNFFSAGKTEIFNSSKEMVGKLDLKSTFSSSIDVLDKDGNMVVSGKFAFFGNKWRISDSSDQEIGVLKQKLTFLSKKYEYETFERGTYFIDSEPFSQEYEITDEQSNQIGRFEKVSGFFSSPAYQLSNFNEKVTIEELIAIVMGVNAIRKRNNAAAGGSGN
ncbi:MAG: hypothetical protein K6T88_15000 [Bacillus sp. (in: Bacteria)]|nr:hypothetical protein [Bacillus sp. (in: firmicutes)]